MRDRSSPKLSPEPDDYFDPPPLEGHFATEDFRHALYHGDLEEIRATMLYDRINSPILPGSDSNLPLMVAATRGRSFVELLLEAGADVNATNAFLGTALQHGAAEGDIETLSLLLDLGANVNAKGGSRGTALIAAVRRGRIEQVELLLGHHADPNQLDGYGFASPLSVAQDSRMLSLLLHNGADPNTRCRDASALIKAVQRSDIPATELLLSHGADPNGKHRGSTALDIAIGADDYRIIEILLENDAFAED